MLLLSYRNVAHRTVIIIINMSFCTTCVLAAIMCAGHKYVTCFVFSIVFGAICVRTSTVVARENVHFSDDLPLSTSECAVQYFQIQLQRTRDDVAAAVVCRLMMPRKPLI